MMKNLVRSLLTLAFVATFSTLALAQTSANSGAASGKGSHPCEAIKQACESAGFIKGDAKQGKGLWKDCIDPIIQGAAQPANATIKLPTVDSGTIAACKAKRPTWGEKH